MTGASDDGQTGNHYRAPATEADMARARDLLHPLDEGKPFTYQERMKYTDQQFTLIQIIADALSVEREKARAPFLALADELDADDSEPGWAADPDYWAGLSEGATRIRRAAEDAQ